MKRRRRAGLDVDGVVLDLFGRVVRAINERRGTRYDADDWRSYNGYEDLGVTQAEFFEIMDAPGFCASLEPYEEALVWVPRIAAATDLEFVTAPWRTGHWVAERDEALARLFPGVPVTHAGDKTVFDGDLFVDDHDRNVRAWAAAYPGREALLWDRPHNRDASDLDDVRTNDWSRVLAAATR